MKRKFKLFATLASLCLSVALMAFGVYAATNVTYNVNSSVSFAAQVSGTWSSQVQFGTKSGDTVTWSEVVDSDTWALSGSELEDGTANAHTWNVNNGSGDSVEDLEFNPGIAKNYVRYTIRFASSSARAASIGATVTQLFSSNALTVRVQESVGTSAPVVAETTTGDVKGILDTSNAAVAEAKAIPSATTRANVAANGYYLLVIEVELTDFTASFAENSNLLTLALSAWAEGYTPAP